VFRLRQAAAGPEAQCLKCATTIPNSTVQSADLDQVQRAALELMRVHGRDAARQAARRAGDALSKGERNTHVAGRDRNASRLADARLRDLAPDPQRDRARPHSRTTCNSSTLSCSHRCPSMVAPIPVQLRHFCLAQLINGPAQWLAPIVDPSRGGSRRRCRRRRSVRPC
jgi:hypothetical protein